MIQKSCICLMLLMLAGCGSTRQIETASPRPRVPSGNTNAEAAGMGVMTIDIETGETSLPNDVQALRFRIEEVRLHVEDGEWITYPGELNSFEILPDRQLGKTILATKVQAAVYDSLALRIRDAFVLFGENAGGPLSVSQDQVLALENPVRPAVGTAVQIKVEMEPAASLTKDNQCRWYFIPFLTAKTIE